MKQGQVVETGTHSELLMREGGAYATLVHLQQQRSEQDALPDYQVTNVKRLGN